MEEEIGKWVSGVIMALDTELLTGHEVEGTHGEVKFNYCAIGALASSTIPTTQRMTELQMAGFAAVGAVLKDGDNLLLCGREGNSERIQRQLKIASPRILAEALVAVGVFSPHNERDVQ